MKKVSVVRQVLADIVKLDDPKTATAVLALAVTLVGPALGWQPTPATQTAIIGAIVAVGVVASFVQKQIAAAVATAKAEPCVKPDCLKRVKVVQSDFKQGGAVPTLKPVPQSQPEPESPTTTPVA